MRASWVYVTVTVLFLTSTSLLLTNTYKPRNFSAATSDDADQLSRDQAVAIASKTVFEDGEPIDGRALFDSQRTADGRWIISVRWYVEGNMHRANVTINEDGEVVELVR
jgi:hypothetical protein